MTAKLSYVITPLAGDWIAGYRRPVGPTIDLLPIEAEYDLRAGTLAPPGSPIPPPVPAPAVALTDRIALLRSGVPLDALLSDLVAVLQLGTLGTKLGIADRLSEIAQAGAVAQTEARANLGLGHVANLAPDDLPVSRDVAVALGGKADTLALTRLRTDLSSAVATQIIAATSTPAIARPVPDWIDIVQNGVDVVARGASTDPADGVRNRDIILNAMAAAGKRGVWLSKHIPVAPIVIPPDMDVVIRGLGSRVSGLYATGHNQTVLSFADDPSWFALSAPNQGLLAAAQCGKSKDIGGLGFSGGGYSNVKGIYGQFTTGTSVHSCDFFNLGTWLHLDRGGDFSVSDIRLFRGGRLRLEGSDVGSGPGGQYLDQDFLKTGRINGIREMAGYGFLGGKAWITLQSTINLLMAQIQTPALMGSGDAFWLKGKNEGAYLSQAHFVWPDRGVVATPDVNGYGSLYCDFTDVAVDQPQGDGWSLRNFGQSTITNPIASFGAYRGLGQPGGGPGGNGLALYEGCQGVDISGGRLIGMNFDGLYVDPTVKAATCTATTFAANGQSSAASGNIQYNLGSDINNAANDPEALTVVNATNPSRAGGVVANSPQRPIVGGRTSSTWFARRALATSASGASDTSFYGGYTFPAGKLTTGRSVTLRASGEFAGNARTKALILKVMGNQTAAVEAAYNGAAWTLTLELTRGEAGALYGTVTFQVGAEQVVRPVSFSAASWPITGLAVVMEVVGRSAAGSAAGDVVCYGMTVDVDR